MDHDVITALMWALVVLLLGLVALGILRMYLKAKLKLRRDESELRAREQAIALTEREIAAQIAARNVGPQAEAQAAELRLQIARTDADAAVAAGNVPDRIEEQRRIIAARTEGTAEAARLHALQAPPQPNPGAQAAVMAELMAGYQAYAADNSGTLSYWFANYEVVDGNLVVIRESVEDEEDNEDADEVQELEASPAPEDAEPVEQLALDTQDSTD